MTRAAAMAQKVDVELQLGPWWGQLDHGVVDLVGRGAGAKEAKPGAHPAHVRVDGNIAPAQGEEEHAGGGLATHPR